MKIRRFLVMILFLGFYCTFVIVLASCVKKQTKNRTLKILYFMHRVRVIEFKYCNTKMIVPIEMNKSKTNSPKCFCIYRHQNNWTKDDGVSFHVMLCKCKCSLIFVRFWHVRPVDVNYHVIIGHH